MAVTLPLFSVKSKNLSTKRKQSNHRACDYACVLPVCAQSELPGLRNGKIWDQRTQLFEGTNKNAAKKLRLRRIRQQISGI
jgi:hypothetical protein